MINQNAPFLANGIILDNYLNKGYYRMGQHLFTTDAIFYVDQYYKVFWLRYDVSKFVLTKKHSKLLNNSDSFEIEIKRFALTERHTTLYNQYYKDVNFDASISLESYLYSFDEIPQLQLFQFESNSVDIFYKKQLIAAGIFDNGEKSIAGIINFYHPDFKKYSLGKLLILLKLRYAIEQNKQFYYPGYIVPGNPKFDYKTFVGIDCIEVFDSKTKKWIEYNSFFNNKH